MSLSYDAATIEDADAIMEMIHALAVDEDQVAHLKLNKATLLATAFGEKPEFQVLLARRDGVPVGFASYMFQFLPWHNGFTLNLDDLYVRPNARSEGIGLALMKELSRIALARDCALRWTLRPDNDKARRFYERLGAKIRPNMNCVLEAKAMTTLTGQG